MNSSSFSQRRIYEFFVSEIRKLKSLPWPYNGYTYSLTLGEMTWKEARKACQRFGGDLAVQGIKEYDTRQ